MDLSWRVNMRCLDDGRRGLKHKREGGFRTELNLQTLEATRGRDFPLTDLASRLRCSNCGCREVRVMFSPPGSGVPMPALRTECGDA
jgi:hypothetical protein